MKSIKNYMAFALVAGMLSACSETDKHGARLKDSSDLAKRADSAGRVSSLPTTDNETHESRIDEDGATFIKNAAMASTMEIDLGKAAMQNSEDPKIKEYGSKMVADHTMAKSNLIKIAEKSGILISNDYPADVKAHIDEMKKSKGKAFDKHYIDMMVKDHAKAVELFKSGTSLRDDVLRDYAANTLPVIQQHQEMAAQLKTSL